MGKVVEKVGKVKEVRREVGKLGKVKGNERRGSRRSEMK